MRNFNDNKAPKKEEAIDKFINLQGFYGKYDLLLLDSEDVTHDCLGGELCEKIQSWIEERLEPAEDYTATNAAIARLLLSDTGLFVFDSAIKKAMRIAGYDAENNTSREHRYKVRLRGMPKQKRNPKAAEEAAADAGNMILYAKLRSERENRERMERRHNSLHR